MDKGRRPKNQEDREKLARELERLEGKLDSDKQNAGLLYKKAVILEKLGEYRSAFTSYDMAYHYDRSLVMARNRRDALEPKLDELRKEEYANLNKFLDNSSINYNYGEGYSDNDRHDIKVRNKLSQRLYQPGFKQYKKRSGFFGRFSKTEVYNILIAWLVLSFAFAYLFSPSLTAGSFLVALTASLIAIAFGFIMHELMHKFSAQNYGYPAEFRLWVPGVLLALVTSLFGFIFAAPGATYFNPDASEMYTDRQGFIERYAKISLAGPKINMIFGFLFMAIFYITLTLAGSTLDIITFTILTIARLTSFVNFYFAAFNMLPLNFGVVALDGYKVFVWKKTYWLFFFLLPAIMSGLMITGVIPGFF